MLEPNVGKHTMYSAREAALAMRYYQTTTEYGYRDLAPRSLMRLAEIGLLKHRGCGRYEITDALVSIIVSNTTQKPGSLPPLRLPGLPDKSHCHSLAVHLWQIEVVFELQIHRQHTIPEQSQRLSPQQIRTVFEILSLRQ